MTDHSEMRRYIEDRMARGLDTPELDGREVLDLLEEISTADKVIAERDRLIRAIPACPVHGQCVPHAIEWVEKVLLLMRTLKAEVDSLTREADRQYTTIESYRSDAERLRWLRRHEFDIGSYHGVQEHNHQAWFEHIDDESIDRAIAEEAQFAAENEDKP
jgi:hypothetical protein